MYIILITKCQNQYKIDWIRSHLCINDKQNAGNLISTANDKITVISEGETSITSCSKAILKDSLGMRYFENIVC